MKKRVISVVLSITVMISCCCVGLYAYAENKTIDVNKELLESLLNDRYWVVETVADGNWANNPYADAAMVPDQTLMEDVLLNYQDDEAFNALVNAMDVYANTGEYLSGFSNDIVTVFMSWFNTDSSEGALGAIDDIVASTAELKYESILNDVLKTDYTSTWGETLHDSNMNLEYMKQLGSILGKISTYQAALKDVVGRHGTTDSEIIIYDPLDKRNAEYEITINDYVDHFLSAYEQDLESALLSAVEIPSIKGNEALKKKILTAGYFGALYAYERVALPEFQVNLDDLYYDGMFKNTLSVIKGAGKVLDIASKSMDYAILLESLQSQKNSTVDVMSRIESNTDDIDLAKVLDNYSDLVNAQGDTDTIAYEIVTNYLRNEQTVTNFVTKKVTDGVPKLIKSGVKKYGSSKAQVLTSSIANNLSRATAIVELAVWVADSAVGIEDTSKKIIVLKYLDKIISEARGVLYKDIDTYQNSKTEENAKKVIDDLELLKALRLYGEKTAKGSMESQMDSWIGHLLGGGLTLEYLEERYQGSIDAFLGCSTVAISQNQLVLSQGDILTISTRVNPNNNESYLYAIWNKASGKSVSFAEPEYKAFAGLSLNGATLRVLSADDGFYMPIVENSTAGAKIEVLCDNVAFGSISNSSEMTIEQKNSNAVYDITERIENSGILNFTGCENALPIKVCELSNESTINITDTELNFVSMVKNNGSINGTVNIVGGEPYFETAYFSMSRRQALIGKGTYSSLRFNNNVRDGVKIGGQITVTDYISNSKTRLYNSENITVTGNCNIENGYFYGNLSFKDFTETDELSLNGFAVMYGNTNFSNVLTINDTLELMECSLTLNMDTTVKGDLLYKSGSVSGNGELSVKGDINISDSDPEISHLNFAGNMSQKFSSIYELTVSSLNNSNTSVDGVDFGQKIYVTDTLYSGRTSAYADGKNIIVTGNAKISGNKINGNFSAEDWVCANAIDIDGTLHLSGDNTISKDCKLTCNNYNQTTGNVTNNGTIFVKNDSAIKGMLSGGTFFSKGDITATNQFTPEVLVMESMLSQEFSNTEATTVSTLTLNNKSVSGITITNTIYVEKIFNDNSNKIINPEKIVLSDGAAYNGSGTTNADMTIVGSYTVKSGDILEIGGNLTVKEGASLIIEDGAEVSVKGGLSISSANLDVQGELTVTEDINIQSSTLSGEGTIFLKGDLNTSSCSWNNPNVCFNGKVGQTVSGSSINVNNIKIVNKSKSGVTFKTNVYYYGELDSSGSVINGSSYLIDR